MSVDAVLYRLSSGNLTAEAALRDLGADGSMGSDEPHWPALVDRLQDYARGTPIDFSDVPVALDHMSSFERRVIDVCRRIPFGQTLSYGQLACLAGSPRAARAAGNVMAANRCPIVIPCHRVIHADGRVGHYSAPAGRRMKLRLLEQEGAFLDGRPIKIPTGASQISA